MVDTWTNEKAKLLAQIASLQAENARLTTLVPTASSTTPTAASSTASSSTASSSKSAGRSGHRAALVDASGRILREPTDGKKEAKQANKKAKAANLMMTYMTRVSSFIDQAAAAAQASGELPAELKWQAAQLRTMTATRHANVHTHSSSSVIKNCHTYREMIAARTASEDEPDLNASAMFDGEQTGIADEDADAKASSSGGDRDNKSAEQVEAQRWAYIILAHLRHLLAADDDLKTVVTADVGTLETPRGGGFLDFTFRDKHGDVIKLRGTGGQRESRPRWAGGGGGAVNHDDKPTVAAAATATAVTPAKQSQVVRAATIGEETKTKQDADKDADSDDNSDSDKDGDNGDKDDVADMAPPTEFLFQSIGVIDSCFPTKYGTPRQGSVAPLARASLTLRDNVHAMTLDGLNEYSHVWLLFIFHSNSNKIIRPKTIPPRLGEKLGIYATRTPHRINPVGLSVVRLDRVEGRTLFLSSIDLIQGTPIVDIKPYHPSDCIIAPQYAGWMMDRKEYPLTVSFSPLSLTQLEAVAPHLQFYAPSTAAATLPTSATTSAAVVSPAVSTSSSSSSLPSVASTSIGAIPSSSTTIVPVSPTAPHWLICNAIAQTLSLDPRPICVKKRHEYGIYAIFFDRLNIVYRMVSDTHMEVVVVELRTPGQRLPKVRTKEWLAETVAKLSLPAAATPVVPAAAT